MFKLTVRNLADNEKAGLKSEIPVIALSVFDGKDFIMTHGYLYPMREYSFQVGGLNGAWRVAASDVIGLGNIVAAFNNYTKPESNNLVYTSNMKVDDIAEYILNAFAVEAVFKSLYNLPPDIRLDNVKIGNCKMGEDDVWSKFIEDSLKWVRSKM